MKKRILSIILAVLIIAAAIPFGAFTVSAEETSGTCGDNLTWNYNTATATLTISGTGDMYDYSTNWHNITTAPWNTYYDTMRTVIISGFVTSIGSSAFYGCTGLTSITIPDSVTSIGGSAFSDCTGLTSVTIGNSVTSIDGYAFSDCTGLTSVTIGNSVTSIGDWAFSGCKGLTSITIPDSVTSIGNYAFEGCYKLVEVINHSSLDIAAGDWDNGDVAYYALTVHNNSQSVIDNQNGFLFIASAGNSYLLGYTGNENALQLPENKNGDSYEIYRYAFFHCTGLTSITIPDSVTSIGEYAFYDCTGLTSVTIGNSVTSIGEDAFWGCTGLTKVNYTGTIADWCNIEFSDYNSNPLYYAHNLYINNELITELIIPDSVNAIGNYAFSGCSALTTVTIPDSVTSIGDYAFFRCDQLTSVTIPDSVTSIGNNAFGECRNLILVLLGKSVTSIGERAFYDCNNIVEVINHSSLNITLGNANDNGGIGQYALTVHSGENSIVDNKDGFLFITSDNNDVYLLDYTGSETELQLPQDYYGKSYSIYTKAFLNCTQLTLVTIPDSVTSIGGAAFQCCTGLTSVTIGNSVNSIGSLAFDGCTGLTSITIPDSVTSIEDCAFLGCSGLTEVVIPDSVTSIGDAAFFRCNKLTDICYTGSQTSWEAIQTENFKNSIEDATIHYNYVIHNHILGDEWDFNNSNHWKICNYCGIKGGLEKHTGGATVKENEVSATCTAQGHFDSVVYCSVCGAELSRDVVYTDALGHDLITHSAKEPTDTEKGWEEYVTCSRCDYTTYRELPALGDTEPIMMTEGKYTYEVQNNQAIIRNVDRDISGNITIPATLGGYPVVIIGSDSFSGCDGITAVTIPQTVTVIENCGFLGCGALASITIPTSLTHIGFYVFGDCNKLKDVYYAGTEQQKEAADYHKGNVELFNATWHYNSTGAPEVPSQRVNFPDVNYNDWYGEAVEYAVGAGLMKGYANGKFGTSDGIQRQDFIVILARLSGANLDNYANKTNFKDAAKGAYYYTALAWAKAEGVSKGYDNGKFGVGDKVTREQIVTFLYNYAKLMGYDTTATLTESNVKKTYSDYGKVSSFAKEATLWALSKGVISGKETSTGKQIAPQANAQRCEVAKMFFNISQNNIFE